MSDWITKKKEIEPEIKKDVENKWIQKKDKTNEKKNSWITKKVKEELAEEKKEWITKKSDKKDGPYITKKKVEEKASGGLIKGFPKLATKGFRR
mgnify:CR=1 FL=1|tara:strand:+ start:310 stop:591 length:282 start_codon:yes stop_codon:yes gene_type:complete